MEIRKSEMQLPNHRCKNMPGDRNHNNRQKRKTISDATDLLVKHIAYEKFHELNELTALQFFTINTRRKGIPQSGNTCARSQEAKNNIAQLEDHVK